MGWGGGTPHPAQLEGRRGWVQGARPLAYLWTPSLPMSAAALHCSVGTKGVGGEAATGVGGLVSHRQLLRGLLGAVAVGTGAWTVQPMCKPELQGAWAHSPAWRQTQLGRPAVRHSHAGRWAVHMRPARVGRRSVGCSGSKERHHHRGRCKGFGQGGQAGGGGHVSDRAKLCCIASCSRQPQRARGLPATRDTAGTAVGGRVRERGTPCGGCRWRLCGKWGGARMQAGGMRITALTAHRHHHQHPLR